MPEVKPAATGATQSSAERILMAAKSLFSQRGYENTSTVAIARQAGTSESQLMKHFGSKDGLLEAIFERGWQQMGQELLVLHRLPSSAEKMRKLADVVMTGLERDPQLKELMLLEGRRIRREGHMVLLTTGYLEFVKMVDGVLEQLKKEGKLAPESTPQSVRSALLGVFEGMLRDQLLAERFGFPATFTSAQMRKTFDVVLNALTGGK